MALRARCALGTEKTVLTCNLAGDERAADFSNLYVVGDWTKTRFSGGCFESAIESAMLASRGISGFPTEIKTS